ncbi:hypothetical protein R1flu_002621 [Riccia fluitans]|uniref:Uncharacterized protein n=1 Tax=Riccia fluitans TaxID=41844 RepID=A0ABD1Y6N0_9MARC
MSVLEVNDRKRKKSTQCVERVLARALCVYVIRGASFLLDRRCGVEKDEDKTLTSLSGTAGRVSNRVSYGLCGRFIVAECLALRLAVHVFCSGNCLINWYIGSRRFLGERILVIFYLLSYFSRVLPDYRPLIFRNLTRGSLNCLPH